MTLYQQGPAMCTAATLRITRRRLGVAALGLALGLGACDSVLEVHDPDIILEATSAAGAVALHNGVFLRLAQATTAGGDNPDGLFLFTGLFVDEFQSGDTFEQRNTTDQRQIAETNSFLSNLSNRINRVRTEGRAAIDALREFAPVPQDRIGMMFSLVAFAENQIGEAWCNGVSFSGVDGPTPVFGEPVPYDSAFRRAVNHADSALANQAGPNSAEVQNLASVVKARALLNRDLHAEAAAQVSGVPTSFVFQLGHSVNAADNALWLQNVSLKRYTVSDNEGINGLPFKTAADPRVPTVTSGFTFDNSGPWTGQQIWVTRDAPVTIASGIEARLIEAEAALRAGNAAGFIAKLNEARATKAALAPLADPGSAVAREDLLFRERAFWLFGTGHRLGDLRRLVRQYGRAEDAVFPTGTWFRGGPYGNDVNFPIPFNETNNPNSPTGCTDRNP
jgi:hypothetical protein